MSTHARPGKWPQLRRVPVRLAVGAPGEGLEGFRRTLRRAELSRAVALAGGERSASVVFYQEVAPVALMAEDFGELQLLVSRVLGDLAVDNERNG